MAAAADVPERYDVVINGVGYMFSEVEAPGTLAYKPEAQFGYTPTFVERTNTQGDFGDNQQAFWLSATQRDWSLGEQQKFFHPNADAESGRRYWVGASVDVSVPGQVTLRNAITALTFPENIYSAAPRGQNFYVGGATKLFKVDNAGAITDLGAHGLGQFADTMTSDQDEVYLASSFGAAKIRYYTSSFGDFSATTDTYAALAYLNNALYAISNSGVLYSFDTGGVRTALFTWRDARGLGVIDGNVELQPYGGKLLILFEGSFRAGAELWIYDGTGVSKVAQFSPNFTAKTMSVLSSGMVLIGGYFFKGGTTINNKPAIFYYLNGTTGALWAVEAFVNATSIGAIVAPFLEGAVWIDNTTNTILFYNPATGGVSTFGVSVTPGVTLPFIVAGNYGWLAALSGTTGGWFWPANAVVTSGSIISSLMDFDSSLDKLFRGIKVDWDAAVDGDGGSVDIAYRLDNLNSSTYTALQTAAVSGTEYLLTGVTGRMISVKITLNKGTSTLGPKVKRVAVRAVPRQQSFRRVIYYLQCTGLDGRAPLRLRDGVSMEPNDGLALIQNLRTAALSQTPVSITDELGTYTGIVELDGLDIRRVKKNEFLVQCPCREV